MKSAGSVVIHDLVGAKIPAARGTFRKDGLRGADLIVFARTLSSLLEGGVPILRAIEGMERAAGQSGLRSVLARIREHLRQGTGLAEALRRESAVPVFVHRTLQAGEMAGKVPEVLAQISRYSEKDRTLRRNLQEALVYPAFIVVSGLFTLVVLGGFVLPKLRTVYDGFEGTLPLLTRAVLILGNLFLPLSALALGGLTLAVIRLRAHPAQARATLERIGWVKDFWNAVDRARFCRLLALLLESGVPILQALEVARQTHASEKIEGDIRSLAQTIGAGHGLTRGFERLAWMDPVSRLLLASGEETGRLDAAFLQVATDTESLIESRLRWMVKLIEPSLIVVIGALVGVVVIGTMLPIFDMSSLVR